MLISRNKNLANIIGQKNFSDPDTGRTLKRGFLTVLNKRLKKKQKLISQSDVLKKYGYKMDK